MLSYRSSLVMVLCHGNRTGTKTERFDFLTRVSLGTRSLYSSPGMKHGLRGLMFWGLAVAAGVGGWRQVRVCNGGGKSLQAGAS